MKPSELNRLQSVAVDLLAYAQCEEAMSKLTKYGDAKQDKALRKVLGRHGYDPEKYVNIAAFLDELRRAALTKAVGKEPVHV